MCFINKNYGCFTVNQEKLIARSATLQALGDILNQRVGIITPQSYARVRYTLSNIV